MNEPLQIQGVFDFETGNADGFENWRREVEARLEAIRREWCVPVGRRVRMRLRNFDGDFEGPLELLYPPAAIDRRLPLRLRIERMEVAVADIEQCIVLD
ncbi:MAG: hypothetical protein PHR35_12120 [Kiritimatiellae bacterium]|nr:hypothetical protein [Kiritimatiellia bacterium]